jgi:hypothetical protein
MVWSHAYDPLGSPLLSTLDADAAKALAGSGSWDAGLPRLTTLDAGTAKALRQCKCKVSLPQ